MQTEEHDSLPHWDLSNVYPALDAPERQADFERLGRELDALEAYLDAQAIGPTQAEAGRAHAPAGLGPLLNALLERFNEVELLAGKLRAFAYSFVTTDSYNTDARRQLSELDGLNVRLQKASVRFQGWLGTKIGRLPAAVAEGGLAAEHAFFLQETAEQSRYLMSYPEEELAAELGPSGAEAWSRLQGAICSQLKVPFERNGQVAELPITVLQNLGNEADGDLRRRAHEAELNAWASVREPLAACLNGVKGAVSILDQRRGRRDALHSAIDAARMDAETLEAMLAAMRAAFPVFRSYLRAKAGLFGREQLPWWDLRAPVGEVSRRFTFPQARAFILDHFADFSPRLAALAERAFEHAWIDAEPRDGKRGGAFCMAVKALEESRILCNFDGSLDQVATIAHELGHAYHNECQRGRSPLQSRDPMTLSETASIMCQTLITEAALAEAAGPQEELAILEGFLGDATAVVVDISSRFLFEQDVFERRQSAELSADDFCAIMLRCQRETYGNGLDPDHLHPYMWAWKPHYYIPELSFYNFPYAFGLLFGLGLYDLYRRSGPAFLDEYDRLLRDTGMAPAAELAGRFGIHLSERAFWDASLAHVAGRVARYVELANGSAQGEHT